MRLSQAVATFLDDPCLDAYSGAPLFKGAVALADGNVRDSETAERRVLTTAGAASAPARRVIQIAGERYILGHKTQDAFRGEVTRVDWVVQEAPELATVYTLAQLCNAQAGATAYSGMVWLRNLGEATESSELYNQVYLQFSSTESIADDSIIRFGSHYHIVRNSVVNAGGMLMCQCEQMDNPVVETGSITTGTYNMLTELTTAVNVTLPVVRVRWQTLFKYRSSIAPKFSPDDIQIAISKSATPVAGSYVTLSDGKWTLQSVLEEHGVWLCRATRYG